MRTNFGSGPCTWHPVGDHRVGQRSRLFVPAVLAAAEVGSGWHVLDISTRTGEAALMTLPIVGSLGVGDIRAVMLYIHFDVAPQPDWRHVPHL